MLTWTEAQVETCWLKKGKQPRSGGFKCSYNNHETIGGLRQLDSEKCGSHLILEYILVSAFGALLE